MAIGTNKQSVSETIIEADILIVGAGIVGSALACALRDSDLKVVLIDKSDALLDTARGDHLQPYTCEILQRWGVLDEFFAAGAEKRAGAIWYSNDGNEVLRSAVTDLDIPHPYFAFINHEKIATILLASALERKNVTCLRPIRNWWRDDNDKSTVRIRVGLPDTNDVIIRSKLLVGADGRSSRVRQSFDFRSSSHLYERSIAVLFASQQERDPERYLKVYLGDDITTSVIPRTGHNCKIGIPVATRDAGSWRGADGREHEQRLLQHCPMLRVSDIEFADIYPPVFLQAESWVNESVVLIGDACHAMHPARSQGMNISIRCIDVLSDIIGNAVLPLTMTAAEQALAAYEARMKAPIDAVLLDNHQWGMAMDRANPSANRQLLARLEAIQSDASELMAYTLRGAGYAHTLPDTQKRLE